MNPNEKMTEELLTTIENMSRTELETFAKKMIQAVFQSESTTFDDVAETAPAENRFSEKNVSKVLRDLGIPASIKGFRCLKVAIPFYAEKNGGCSMTKDLYPYVSKILSTTPSRVERAIRHAIEHSSDRGNQELIEKYFGYSVNPMSGKATNSEFIAAVVEYMRNA